MPIDWRGSQDQIITNEPFSKNIYQYGITLELQSSTPFNQNSSLQQFHKTPLRVEPTLKEFYIQGRQCERKPN